MDNSIKIGWSIPITIRSIWICYWPNWSRCCVWNFSFLSTLQTPLIFTYIYPEFSVSPPSFSYLLSSLPSLPSCSPSMSPSVLYIQYWLSTSCSHQKAPLHLWTHPLFWIWVLKMSMIFTFLISREISPCLGLAWPQETFWFPPWDLSSIFYKSTSYSIQTTCH